MMENSPEKPGFTEFGAFPTNSPDEGESESKKQKSGIFGRIFGAKKVKDDKDTTTDRTSIDSTSFAQATSGDVGTSTSTSSGNPNLETSQDVFQNSKQSGSTRSLDNVAHAYSKMSQRIVAFLNPIAQGNRTKLKDYNRSDFRQYWMPDSFGKECYDCQEKFTTFRRRHHCRICGQIFCSRCCYQAIPGRLLGYTGELRLCSYCCKAVVQYLDSPDGKATYTKSPNSSDVRQLKINLLQSLEEAAAHNSSEPDIYSSVPRSPRTPRPVLPAERKLSWDVWDAQSEFYIPRHSSLAGADVIPPLEITVTDSNVPQQNLDESLNVSTGRLAEEVSEFLDDEPEWVKSIEDSFRKRSEDETNAELKPEMKRSEDVPKRRSSNLGITVDIDKDIFPAALASPSNRKPSHRLRREISRSESIRSVDGSNMPKLFEQFAQKLLRYLLYRHKLLSDVWYPVLWPAIRKAAYSLQPNVKNRKDDMAVATYVHVKTLQTGDKPQAHVIFGTICSKTVADVKMRQNFLKPRVLVIGSSIEYERVEGKFCSIDPVISQETEYLRAAVAKIAASEAHTVEIEK